MQTPVHHAELGDRQAKVLGAVIREYVKSAEPVGSKTIVDEYDLGVSPATIRNDMMLLEEMGFFASPHTSAGRVPTISGYRYYVHNLLADEELPRQEEDALRDIFGSNQAVDEQLKETAKAVAGFAAESVFVAFHPHATYYTGFRYLFSQPEFRDQAFATEIGKLIDQLDIAVAELYDHVEREVRVFVGNESPFGSDCSAVAARLRTTTDAYVIGILGPVRMDYDSNVARLTFIQNHLNVRV